jgi:putative ABC transport system permease protein
VACQVAAAFVLTTVMALIFVSVRNVTSIHPGFAAQGLTTVSFDVPRTLFAEPAKAHAIVARVLEEVRRVPGVDGAGVTQLLPFGGRTAGWRVRPPEQPSERAPLAWNYIVSPGYLPTMQVPLLAGRYLDDRDHAESEPVMVISRQLAEQLWPGSTAVGRKLIIDALMPAGRFTVVGVVDNVRQATLAGATDSRGAIYRPYLQTDERSYTLVVRSGSSDAAALAAVVRSVDPRLAPYDVRTMPERLEASIASRRLALVNAAIFAAVALLLATAGLYAVLTYFVAGRRREFGIRSALGSSPRDLAAVVSTESLWVTAAGLLIGLVVLRFIRPILAPHLHAVGPWESPTLVGAAVLVAVVAVLASLGPARRAAATDALLVLRA